MNKQFFLFAPSVLFVAAACGGGGGEKDAETDGSEPCTIDRDCDDGDPCTLDSCDEGSCVHGPMDLDDDGYGDAACGGDDCDDGDEEVNPAMEELCSDGKDNDCNGAVDTDDESCIMTNDTCAESLILSEGGLVDAATFGMAHDYDSSECAISDERDVVFQFDLEEARDIEISLSGEASMYFAIQTECGNAVSELLCREFPDTVLVQLAALPAGTYYVVVWTAEETEFRVLYFTMDPATRPANDQCDGAVDVSAGGTYHGINSSSLNDYAPSCLSREEGDVFYTFTTTEAGSVSIVADASDADFPPHVTLALMSTCGDPATELACDYGDGSVSIARSLSAGTYWIAVETWYSAAILDQSHSFDLSVTF